MMLKHPGTNIDFVVHLAAYPAIFDIYDREESLGVYLDRFDPNDVSQLSDLFKDSYRKNMLFARYTIAHKYEVIRLLERSLSEPSTDFAAELCPDRLAEGGTYLPMTWRIKNPRQFFAVAYKVIYDLWHAEIEASGLALTDPSRFLEESD